MRIIDWSVHLMDKYHSAENGGAVILCIGATVCTKWGQMCQNYLNRRVNSWKQTEINTRKLLYWNMQNSYLLVVSEEEKNICFEYLGKMAIM